MLIEPPAIGPAIEVDTSVPMLDLPTMDLPGAPTGAPAPGESHEYVGIYLSPCGFITVLPFGDYKENNFIFSLNFQ